MRSDFTTLHADMTVEQALASLRMVKLGEKVVYFYVVAPDGALVGVVPTRRLLMSAPPTPIREIMIDRVITIPHTMTVLDACEFFVMHRLLAFPVVDESNRLLGVVDVSLFTDEMFEVTEEHARRDVFQLIGLQLDELRTSSAVGAFTMRFPWLLCNMTGGVACAMLASRYEPLLNSAIILALFIPVVLALAESVSMQSTTLALQNMDSGQVRWRRILAGIWKELQTALLLGAACGLTVALVVLAWKHEVAAAVAIGISISISVVTACLLGVTLPLAVRLLRIDPKIAAGPIVLAAADILTLLFYFNLAGWMLTPKIGD